MKTNNEDKAVEEIPKLPTKAEIKAKIREVDKTYDVFDGHRDELISIIQQINHISLNEEYQLRVYVTDSGDIEFIAGCVAIENDVMKEVFEWLKQFYGT